MSLAEMWSAVIHADVLAPFVAFASSGMFQLIATLTFGSLAIMLTVDLLTSAYVAARQFVTGKDAP